MKYSLPVLLSLCVLVSGCSGSTTTIEKENQNPLSRSRYHEDLASTLANFIIQKEAFTAEEGVAESIKSEIIKAKSALAEANAAYAKGMKGALISMKAPVTGTALLKGDALYFSTDFETSPGVNLHVYLTEAVDPRDVTFPDETAVDLGVIQSAYGAQTYAVPAKRAEGALRTVVLWDKKYHLLYSFGQLSK